MSYYINYFIFSLPKQHCSGEANIEFQISHFQTQLFDDYFARAK